MTECQEKVKGYLSEKRQLVVLEAVEKREEVMEKKKKENFVCIFRTPYQSEIVVIKSLLDGYKIPYFIENEHFASLRGPADGAINFGVMIQTSSAEQAKELLKDFISPKKGAI